MHRIALFLEFGDDFGDDGFVVVFEAAPGGVGNHFARRIPGELFAAKEDELLELVGGREFDVAGEGGAAVDGLSIGILFAPAADGVVVLKAEAERVDSGMAARAGWIFAMLGKLLTEGEATGLGVVFRKFTGIGRGRRGGVAEDGVKNPNAAMHRAGAERKRSGGEDRTHAEEAAAVLVVEGDFF